MWVCDTGLNNDQLRHERIRSSGVVRAERVGATVRAKRDSDIRSGGALTRDDDVRTGLERMRGVHDEIVSASAFPIPRPQVVRIVKWECLLHPETHGHGRRPSVRGVSCAVFGKGEDKQTGRRAVPGETDRDFGAG